MRHETESAVSAATTTDKTLNAAKRGDARGPLHPGQFTHPRHWPTWIGLLVLRLGSVLPLPVLSAIGRSLGTLFYYLHARRRRIVAINIAKAFSHLDTRAQRRLARAHFRALGQAFFDAGVVWWASRRRLRRLVTFRNREHYDRALSAGRHVILLAPHFVAMEVGGVVLSGERPVVTMYRETKNALFNALLRHARVRFGGQIVERTEGLKPTITALKRGKVFYYLPDQDLGNESTVFVPFFGVPTATLAILGRLAKITHATVIPCYSRQRPFGRGYEIIFGPPLADFPTGDDIEDARRMNAAIETGVRAMPEQYFWVHKRFKTRPPGEPDFYT
jgi:KDO2-lipid IV(A) lauroyltransferase